MLSRQIKHVLYAGCIFLQGCALNSSFIMEILCALVIFKNVNGHKDLITCLIWTLQHANLWIREKKSPELQYDFAAKMMIPL